MRCRTHPSVQVLVNVIGHVPETVPSLLVTVSPPSPHPSVIVNPFERRYARVSVGDSKSPIPHPSVAIAARVPVITGAWVSSIVMVWVAVVALPHASVTV